MNRRDRLLTVLLALLNFACAAFEVIWVTTHPETPAWASAVGLGVVPLCMIGGCYLTWQALTYRDWTR